MPAFEALQYRDCAWCGVKLVAMHLAWSQASVASAIADERSWAAFVCPRCGGVTLVEVSINDRLDDIPSGAGIDYRKNVTQIQTVPESQYQRYNVNHLPDDVSNFLTDAIRVLDAGIPDAAAVQLRRTLEAAAAKHDVRERTLMQ